MRTAPHRVEPERGPQEEDHAAAPPHAPAGRWARVRHALCAGLRAGRAALARAEERIIENFRPPPGGG